MSSQVKSDTSSLSSRVVITPQDRFIRNRISILGSKSHSIRALLLAGLAQGSSIIYNVLNSQDTQSCINLLERLGVVVNFHSSSHKQPNVIEVHSRGLDTFIYPHMNDDSPIDLGNSGTTLYFATALAGLSHTPLRFEGDDSLRTRSAAPLLEALATLGAHITTGHTQSGCVPYAVSGPISHGTIHIECSTSQYLSALILALSLVKGESTINAKLVGEFPYIDMTLSWLKKHDIHIKKDDAYSKFHIQGSGVISPFTERIPGDFSSAAFFLGIAAITGNTLYLEGLQKDTTQADMAILDILQEMGCEYSWEEQGTVSVLKIAREGELVGGEFDLSNIPDSLPILSVVAAYASSPTRMYNVAHARKKETDRIQVMSKELISVGVPVEEMEDGLIITPSPTTPQFKSGEIYSHHDHRIAMAFACGAVGANGPITIHDADAVAVTFPNFFNLLQQLGIKVHTY